MMPCHSWRRGEGGGSHEEEGDHFLIGELNPLDSMGVNKKSKS